MTRATCILILGALAVASGPPERSNAADAPASAADQGLPQAQSLQEVVVTSSYQQQTDSSMKMGIPVRDTPFSIESYSNSFLSSIQTQQIADLYRYMTGLQKAGITGYSLVIRGFSTADTDRNTILTDGLPGLAVRFGTPLTIGYDHVELLKGPASLLYGQATPGGMVNIITKKPQADTATTISSRGTINASDYSRVLGGDVAFDSTGALGSDRLLYRVIGQISDDRYFRNSSYERNKYLLPMLTAKLGDATTATLQFEYQEIGADYENVGLLAPYTAVAATVAQLASIQTVYTAPGTSRDERGTTTSLFIKHDLGGGGSLNLGVRSVDHHDYANAFDITGFDNADKSHRTLDLRARGQWNQRTYNFADLNAVLPFDVGGIGNRVIVGTNAGKEIDDFQRTQFCNLNSPGKPTANASCNLGTNQYTVSVYDPNFSVIPPPHAFGAGSLADNWNMEETAAAYLSDLITFNAHWKALAGVRYSRDKYKVFVNKFDPTQAPYEQDYHSTVPEAGLIYEPSESWSYYVSYSESYSPVDPSSGALISQPLFKPTESKGEEAGVKADLDHHRISFTGAVYLIKERNVLTPYPGGTDADCPTGSCMVQAAAARSKGVELEVSAKPTNALTLIAGYTYGNAVFSQSTATGPLVGHKLPNWPTNAAHLWSRYDILNGPMRGFGAGLGVTYAGTRIADTGTAAVPGEFALPSYTVVDFAVYKEFTDGLYLTLKLNNVFDKTYYQDGNITSGMVSVDAGTPRTAELDLNWTF